VRDCPPRSMFHYIRERIVWRDILVSLPSSRVLNRDLREPLRSAADDGRRAAAGEKVFCERRRRRERRVRRVSDFPPLFTCHLNSRCFLLFRTNLENQELNNENQAKDFFPKVRSAPLSLLYCFLCLFPDQTRGVVFFIFSLVLRGRGSKGLSPIKERE